MPYGVMNRIPYKLPSVILPAGTRCVQITIPDSDEWENQLYSLISAEFCRWLMWDRDIGKNGKTVASRWRVALKTLRHCKGPALPGVLLELPDMSELVQVICDESGDCVLQYRCDVCSDWITIATLDQLKNPSQPGGGSPQPQPGGGSQCYGGQMDAKGTWLVPTVVNAGDVITLMSSSGAEYDGGGSDHWRCPDGATFIAGVCVEAGQIHVGGDPSASAWHMALIAEIAGVFYDLSTPVTVPGGVVNEQVTIQANDSDISNNQGSYKFNVCVKNNTAAAWCYDINFLLTSGGFVDDSIHGGSAVAVWNAGVGWKAPAGGTFCDTAIARTVALQPGTIVEYDWVGTSFPDDTEAIDSYNGATRVNHFTANLGASGSMSRTITAVSTSINLEVNAGNNSLGAAPVAITHARFSGTGVNPFGTSNC